MSDLREVCPSGSYSLQVPKSAEEDIDGTVASYWLSGDELLLQISSYVRECGGQVSAADRLLERFRRDGLRNVAAIGVEIENCPDVAAAVGDDDEGLRWMYVYAVWPWITVLMTVSHPENDVACDSWARQAITSLRIRGGETPR